MNPKSDSSWILGIDTSNYTTSVAAISVTGEFLGQSRQLLPVASGERGLRQSDAVFSHLKALDHVFSLLQHPQHPPVAIGVSDRPRALSQSYMPVFLVGLQFAKVMSQILQVPLFLYSHQEGHIEAGFRSSNMPELSTFLTVHLSGGTTELLQIDRHATGYNEKILVETSDLSAGQFIDRIGVAMGLPFPSGPSLEILARQSTQPVRFPSSFKENHVSFSGVETQALRAIDKGANPADIARGIEACISTTLEKMILFAQKHTKLRDVLIVGGVASNQFIRLRLHHRLEHPAVGLKLYFASPDWSSDNAVGTAFLGVRSYQNRIAQRKDSNHGTT